MTIDIIKNKINDRVGDSVKVIYNGSRNRREEYSGVISEIYSYIFIVRMESNEKKSFSYSDILTNTVEIIFDKL